MIVRIEKYDVSGWNQLLAVLEYLQLLSEGGLKDKSDRKGVTWYIRIVGNHSVEWFAQQLETCGDYFVKLKQLIVRKEIVHKKIASYINDEDIRSDILTWVWIQKTPQQTVHNLRQFVITELLPDQEIISANTSISWINNISFNVANTDNKKGLIYIDGNERPYTVAYRNQFCDRWFIKYLPRMLYFGCVDMKRVDTELKAGDTDIV